jgi:thiamine-monophosphate kinase
MPHRPAHEPARETLSALGEKGLIRKIAGWIPVPTPDDGLLVGIGDDTAVMDFPSRGEYLLLKTDAVVEGVHFEPGTEPERVGWKAAGRVVSDFAAMGGRPCWLMVTLVLRNEIDLQWIERMYAGIRRLAERCPLEVVGGETVRTAGPAVISISGAGKVGADHLVLRSGAHPGDILVVTGSLGGSILGKHLDFEPRLREAQVLAGGFQPAAMLDISDGLARDAIHLGEASGIGIEIWSDRVPVSPEAIKLSAQDQRLALEHALYDGEDFELLAALPEGRWQQARDALQAECGTTLTAIGRCLEAGAGFHLVSGGTRHELKDKGWDHFVS